MKIGDASHRRGWNIRNRDDREFLFLEFLHAGDGVCRLAGLRQEDEARIVLNKWSGVDELGSAEDFARDAAELLEEIFGHIRGVHRGAAGDEIDLIAAADSV